MTAPAIARDEIHAAASGFAVICDARYGAASGIEVLALVDRQKTRTCWWTPDDASIAICYQREGAAHFAANRLRANGPRVVPFVIAKAMLDEQAELAAHRGAQADAEADWDSHKEWL